MVSSIMLWRDANLNTCEEIWLNLDKCNMQIEKCFQKLESYKNSAEYQREIEYLSSMAPDKWATVNDRINSTVRLTLSTIFKASQTARGLLRRMGQLANVPIEPPAQSELLDATLKIPGVLMAAVPGGALILI